MSAPHTNDLHADEYDDEDITINRTEVLSFGAGVRFRAGDKTSVVPTARRWRHPSCCPVGAA
ncbi:hypothetical protein GGR60_004277 [Xanthomonas arboricola]|uniref:hypothetical protein n=1 Tax=Xanthomonas euroxanthea TaxID=2259622 RepID=UPI0014304E5D|nr:hypothetical protein [Xanthomonas euroxanthea]NJC39695.1 hypothetical protein [Xanthomonas euroxanthea]